MFSKFQKASDKVLLFIRNTTNCAGFVSGSRLSMTSKSFPKVQLVYDICKKIFTPSGSPPPSFQSMQKLSSLLGISLFSLFLCLELCILFLFKRNANIGTFLHMGFANYIHSCSGKNYLGFSGRGEKKSLKYYEIRFAYLAQVLVQQSSLLLWVS